MDNNTQMHPLLRDLDESLELRQLTADGLKLVELQTQLINQLQAYLRGDYMMSLEAFSSLNTQIAHSLLMSFLIKIR